jgi:phenylacetate-CoA ligase
MEAAGLAPADITTVDDLGRLPVLPKEQLPGIQQSGPNLGGMLAVPLGQLRRIFESPGPIYDPEPHENDAWRFGPAYRAAGFGPGDVVLNCFGYHLTPAGVLFEEGARAAGCVVIPAGIGNQAQQVAAIAALGVTGYTGLPSYLKALLEKAGELGHDPRAWPLKKAFVSAEPLPPSLRAWFKEEYGIEVYQGYGTAECGNLGYEGPERDGWRLPDDALVQVCDINTGQPLPPGHTGEIVVTLFREDFVVVRLGVGDLSALMDAQLTAEIPVPRLVGWLGRSGDSVKVRGIFVHPRHAEEAIRRVAGVGAYQIVITRHEHRDELSCRVTPVPDADPSAVAAEVAAALQQALKLRCGVAIVETIQADAKRFVDERTWD